jgi:GDP-4-dehydro-6-deoxy-D-mannose reductase
MTMATTVSRADLPISRPVLITGIAGFAGGFLAEHLLQCGDSVLGCSPNGDWEPASSPPLRDAVELVEWDLSRDNGLADEAWRRIEAFRPEVIYHLAAMSVPQDCGTKQPSPLALAINVEGTRRVFCLAGSLSTQPRVLFVSSSLVYAPVDFDSPRVSEDALLGPIGAYGRTKLAAEEVVRRAVQEDGRDGVIVRAFQHTGPRQIDRMMLPQWARQFASADNGPVKIHTRDARIDLADVRDVVRAYRLLAERGAPGAAYNVGSGVSRRTGDVFDLLYRLAGSNRGVEETRPGSKQDPIADVDRLVNLTGWRPEISLEKTVADTLGYWRRQAANQRNK